MAEIIDTVTTESALQRYSILSARLRLEHPLDSASALQADDEHVRYVNRFVQQGRADLAAEFLQEVGANEIGDVSALERVIQQNDLMSVAFFPRGIRAARTVCRIVIRDPSGRLLGHGTGFMISPSLLMTNNHVLPNPAMAASSTLEFDFALGIDGNPLLTRAFRLDPARFFETHDRRELDFSIVAVEPVNESGDRVEERGWITLIPESGKAVVGEPLNIIQHPAGEHMQIAIRENEVLQAEGNYFIYTTDTKRGSSGAPVLNDQWQVAALHHAAVPNRDAEGNWLCRDGGVFRRGVDDPSSIDWIANEGVRISRIVTEMRRRGLSAEKRELFEEALNQPAPLQAPEETSFSDVVSALHPPQNANPTIGSGGVAHWNFQLSFGLLPTQTIRDHPMAPPPSPTPLPSLSPVLPAPDERNIESLFEPRGDYYSAIADREAAATYYGNIESDFARLSSSEHFDALNKLVTDTHSTILSYSSARHDHLYPWIDRHPDAALRSIYSNEPMAEELFVTELRAFEAATERTVALRGTESMGLSEAELELIDLDLEATTVFNCEHVVPQSWFEREREQRAQKSDLHHLFTCDSRCNSFRSNIPYWDFSPEDEARLRSQEIGLAEAQDNGVFEGARIDCGLREGRRFEPDSGKGAAARATLYFILRYPGVVGNVKTGHRSEFVKSNVGLLINWAAAEPPSPYERHRNAEIEKVQGNRNPLIDHPDWLAKVDFERGFG